MTLPRILFAVPLILVALAGCSDVALPSLPPYDNKPSPTHVPAPTSTDQSSALKVKSTPGLSLPEQFVSGDTPTPEPVRMTEAADSIPVPPERDLYRLAKELIPGIGEVSRVEGSPAPTLTVGHRRSFELVDLERMERYQSGFELRLVTPNAYWFVEDGLEVEQEDIELSAANFEDTIYPRITGAFGTEWKPGVDGDPHLYVLNASLALVGGYYSPADEYPQEIRPVSNEIEAIYINVRHLPIGSDIYSLVLAHELQHAIHWNADPSEASWFNEGLSELAVTLAGYPETSVLAFRRAGPTSLTVWPAGEVGGAENYGAASLFMHYFTWHYADRTDLRPLISLQNNGIEAVDAFLHVTGRDIDFTDVFRDWAVANLLDEDTGRYGYGDMDITLPVYRSLEDDEEIKSSIPQYATEYVRLELPEGPSTLTFDGDREASLLPVDANGGCWWSNNGDDIDSTLTAHADLRDIEEATLDYQVWYAIEKDWDYVYLEVSIDRGDTWHILETAYSSSSNPLSSAFGPGYTGFSKEWVNESVQLDKWVEQEILIRFQYITDAALHDHGLCLRNLQISGLTGDIDSVEWLPNGFVWTNNLVRQDFIVQVIYEGKGDSANRVLEMELDDSNSGEMTLQPEPDARRVVAAVQSMAPSTRMPANYQLKLKSAQ